MQDPLGRLKTLTRPRVLVRAARFGQPDYRRERHLPHLLGGMGLPRSFEALIRLLDIEAELNEHRRNEAPAYSPRRHLDVMIAIMGEAHILRTACKLPAT